MFPRTLLALLVAILPLAAAARLATVPLEMITVGVPAAAEVPATPLCHEATDELSAAGTCAMCASCHVPPAPAAGGAPRPAAAPVPREAERRGTRRQAERLDRPPFIRPM